MTGEAVSRQGSTGITGLAAAPIAVLVATLADALRARGACIATAESCTGGLIAGACTDLAGSSDWFDRGFVTYSNAAKTELLGVDAGLIASQGAVSEPVACAMAAGALARSPAALTVAVTGVAGPGGGSAAKPVGLVWLAWSWRDAGGAVQVQALQQHFDGDRAAVRQATVVAALQGLLARVPGLPEVAP
jgi:nicotinamide-nucleotide amidase